MPGERSERARKAAEARWAKLKTPEARAEATAPAREAWMATNPDFASLVRRRHQGKAKGKGSMAKHGSNAKYIAGCRCSKCIGANRRRQHVRSA